MNSIRSFLLVEAQNGASANEFIEDFNRFKSTGTIPELKTSLASLIYNYRIYF